MHTIIIHKILFILFFVFVCSGCDEVIQSERRAPLGEVWLNINGELYKYNKAGTFTEDSNGYTENIKFLSIMRRNATSPYNNVVIRIIPFNLDATAPITTKKASFAIYFENGAKLRSDTGDVSVTITDITDDILTGTYIGEVYNVDRPNVKYAISGSLKIKIQRF